MPNKICNNCGRNQLFHLDCIAIKNDKYIDRYSRIIILFLIYFLVIVILPSTIADP